MSKYADWCDTFFYVLRKKDSHINFLHLYHHISVPTFGYLILKACIFDLLYIIYI